MSGERHEQGGGPEGGARDVFDVVMAWLESGVRTPELDRAEAADPARFAARVALARAVRLRLEDARWPAPSEANRRAALALVRDVGAVERAGALVGKAWRTLRATLVDLGAEPALVYRSGGRAPFFALYAVEGYDIDVTLSEHGTLLGQVLPVGDGPSFGGGRCHAITLDGTVQPVVAPIGPDGDFVIEGPFASPIELVLERDSADIAGTRIVVERVDLGRGDQRP